MYDLCLSIRRVLVGRGAGGRGDVLRAGACAKLALKISKLHGEWQLWFSVYPTLAPTIRQSQFSQNPPKPAEKMGFRSIELLPKVWSGVCCVSLWFCVGSIFEDTNRSVPAGFEDCRS